ncbi:hypothetical protein VE02_03526 [Pseudogymnoascus sp. 03VT05]|nr:hypothetical protein VE02_03526 [Pseudogymnoascus sp. 03VT05]
MSINNGGQFVADNNNLVNFFDDQLHMGYQGAMDGASLANQYGNQTAPAGVLNGITHPGSSYEGQASESRHVSFGQDGGLGFNPYMRQQIGGEPLQSHTPTPAPMVNNNNTQLSSLTAYPQNQTYQPEQSLGMNHGLHSLPSPSDMGMRPRTGRGVLPPRLPESGMGFGFNSFSAGNGDMASYNPQAPTPMHAFGNGYSGTTNTAQAREKGSKFRRSPLNIEEPRYDNQNGFASAQHVGMQSRNSANVTPGVGHSSSVFQPQDEAEGWTRDQIHKHGGAPSLGRAPGKSPVLANDEADATDDSDSSEGSDGTVCSPADQDLPNGQEPPTVQGSATAQGSASSQGSTTAQGKEGLAGDDRRLRPGVRLGGEPMSSRKFKGHFDRAVHRAGGSPQKVGTSSGRRSKGANNPENIEIVNWYDNHNMSFPDIARRLNDRQEAKGKLATFTPNSIHNRYNRCAPIIYQAYGRVFVAIKDRKKHAPEELDAMSIGSQSVDWTPLKDDFLKRTVEAYEANKWDSVAESFAAATKERVSARTVATRYGMMI